MTNSKSNFFACLFFLLMLVISNSTISQPIFSDSTYYHFINYDLNEIKIPGDSTGYKSFVNKYRELASEKNRQINVVHIGGSHVQADMWTSRLRENFNRSLSQAESCRGIIFPYRAVKTNGSLQFDIVYDKLWDGLRNVKLLQPDSMGLMGWNAIARDSGQFIDVTLKGDTVSSFYFNRLRVFHQHDSATFNFTINVDDSIFYPQYNANCGCSEIAVSSKSKRFILTTHKTDSLQTKFVLQGIQTIFDMPGFTYHSVGVNGASVKSYLNCGLLPQQLSQLKPDLIVFSIGINDSFDKDFSREMFEAGYNDLIQKIKLLYPEATFLFISNTDSYKKVKKKFYKNTKGREVQLAMESLAKQNGAAFWDLFGVMGGLGSMSQWKKHGLAQRDMIHLNRKGYNLIGDLMFEAIVKSINDSKF